jgi:hypothetical protein
MRLRADHSAVVAESPGTVLARALNGLSQIGFSNWPGSKLRGQAMSFSSVRRQ